MTCDGPVTCVSAFEHGEEYIFVIGTSKGTASLFKLEKALPENPVLVRNLSFPANCVLSCAISSLPGSKSAMVALGLTNGKIELYSIDESFKVAQKGSLTGHENWVRGLSFLADCEDLFLASCSQDRFIRIWKIFRRKDTGSNSIAPMLSTASGFSIEGQAYEVWCESVIQGHEDWVYSVEWAYRRGSDDGTMRLVSASADKSVMIWEPDAAAGIWTNRARLGEIGGNSQGYYGAVFDPSNQYILAQGYSGGLTVWNSDDDGVYVPVKSFTGHVSSVEEISWNPDGLDLLSVSKDQTARIFSECKAKDGKCVWAEIARPQIHGYDLKCASYIDSLDYISGADEKVLRIFQATRNFAEQRAILKGETAVIDDRLKIVGANVPALGLSNKAVVEGEDGGLQKSSFTDNRFLASDSSGKLERPFLESELINRTLWPEIDKLYGHVFEMQAVACSHDSQIIASAARASIEKYAAIFLWKRGSWERKALSSHSLTVTKIAFSHNDQFILTVSRDRTWTIFQKTASFDFELFKKGSGHSRIIWSCSWTFDDRYFVTCSRDKKINIWNVEQTDSPSCTQSCHASVTAVDFYGHPFHEKHLLAAGFEDGSLSLYSFCPASHQLELLKRFEDRICHGQTVNDIKWNPNRMLVASCGADNTARIFSIAE